MDEKKNGKNGVALAAPRKSLGASREHDGHEDRIRRHAQRVRADATESAASTARIDTLPLGAIRVDFEIQSRVTVDESVVRDYAEAIASGAMFPAVVVFDDGTEKWLADGFHRHAAYRTAGKFEIPAKVIDGTRRDAILYSVGANAKMGLRPKPQDLRKAVTMLLDDSEWFRWSDKAIADRCSVSRTSVRRWRAEFCLDRGIPLPETVLSDDGGESICAHRAGSTPKPRYKVRRVNGKQYGTLRFCGRNVRYLGRDGPDAREKFDVEKTAILEEYVRENARKRVSLTRVVSFVSWLTRRGVPAEGTKTREAQGLIPGLQIGTTYLTLVPKLTPRSICQAIGELMITRAIHGDSTRVIAVCYPVAKFRVFVELAESIGVEFLTPDQVVEQFSTRPDSPSS